MVIVVEGVFFFLFNFEELVMVLGCEWEVLGVYIVGFFCFWGNFVVCGLLVVWLMCVLLRECLCYYV